MEFRILVAHESDLYRRLRLESLIESPDSFCTTFEIENARERLFFQKNIEEQSKTNFVVGCFDNLNLIGICGFYLSPDDTNTGILVQLYVKKEYQRRGIATQLINTLIEKAFSMEDIRKIQLEVLTRNKSVVKLYSSLGFVEYNFQKNAVQQGDRFLDLIFMELKK